MSKKIETVSRRRAFCMLGGVVGVGLPVALLTVSNAVAQTPGMERREERREDRLDRREERRDDRQDRREDRRQFGREDETDDRQGTVGQGSPDQKKPDTPAQNK